MFEHVHVPSLGCAPCSWPPAALQRPGLAVPSGHPAHRGDGGQERSHVTAARSRGGESRFLPGAPGCRASLSTLTRAAGSGPGSLGGEAPGFRIIPDVLGRVCSPGAEERAGQRGGGAFQHHGEPPAA